MGLQAVAGLNIVVRVAMAALAVALLRRLPPIGQSEPDSALAAAAAADQHPKPAPRAHRSLVSSPIQP